MKHIDDWFREELGDGRETPPPQVWTQLERRLDERRPKHRLWLWWITPVLLMGLLAGAYRSVDLMSRSRTAEAAAVAPATEASASPLPTEEKTTGAVSPSAAPVPHDQASVSSPAGKPAVAAGTTQNHPIETKTAAPSQPSPVSRTTATAGTPGDRATGAASAPHPPHAAPSETIPSLRKQTSAPDAQTAPDDTGRPTATPASSTPATHSLSLKTDPPVTRQRNRRDRKPTTLPAAGNTVQRSERQPFEPTEMPQRISGRRTPGGNPTTTTAGSPTVTAGVPVRGNASPVRPGKVIARNSPAMDSAIRAFNASGARLKIREGHFVMTIDTLIPAASAAAAGLAGKDEAMQNAGDSSNPSRRRFDLEYGVRVGAEAGFASGTTTKFIAGPYIKLPLGKRFALSAQPAIRYGTASGRSFGTQSYYSNPQRSVDSFLVFDTSGTVVVQRKYVARQQYDSSTITHTLARRMLEFELPLLMHYSFSNSFSVFGGFLLSFGKVIDLRKEQKDFGKQVMIKDTLYSVAPIPQSQLEEIPFNHTAQPLSSYRPGDYANPAGNPLRLGYMLGISYQLKERISIDLSMQQTPGGNFIPNAEVRKIYTQPYFRLMIHYRLGKGEK